MGLRYDTYATPRADLGAAFQQANMKIEGFIGLDVATLLEVKKEASTISVHTRESALKLPDAKHASGAAYNRINVELEDLAYACQEYGLEIPLVDDKRAKHKSDFDAEALSVDALLLKLMLLHEKRVADMIFNTTTWTGAALYTDNKAAPWSTAATDVIGQIQDAIDKVVEGTGVVPNVLIIPKSALSNLMSNTGIIARFPGIKRLTAADLAAGLAPIFGLERVLVGQRYYDEAEEGATFDSAAIWNYKYAMVAKVASGNLAEPCVARSLLWTGDSPEVLTIDQYREEQTRSDIFRVRHYMDELVCDSAFAHLMRIET